jgi:hypothetical protein
MHFYCRISSIFLVGCATRARSKVSAPRRRRDSPRTSPRPTPSMPRRANRTGGFSRRARGGKPRPCGHSVRLRRCARSGAGGQDGRPATPRSLRHLRHPRFNNRAAGTVSPPISQRTQILFQRIATDHFPNVSLSCRWSRTALNGYFPQSPAKAHAQNNQPEQERVGPRFRYLNLIKLTFCRPRIQHILRITNKSIRHSL